MTDPTTRGQPDIFFRRQAVENIWYLGLDADAQARDLMGLVPGDVEIANHDPAFGRAIYLRRTAGNKTDPINQWVNQLRERRDYNRAAVAVANKNARIIWAVLRTGEAYCSAR